MLSTEQLRAIVTDMESELVERKESPRDKDRVQQAICAYANDLPNHQSPGYILIGVRDDGGIADLDITDQLLLNLSSLRDTGKILPMPHLNVERAALDDKAFAVVRVFPSDTPPVRFEGQVWIRVGPRRAIATAEEERRLLEKNVSGTHTFDRRACRIATLEDLLLDVFRHEYLPSVVDRAVIAANHREIKEQLASLRLYDLRSDAPTFAGLLVIGRDPLEWLPGAYIQFVRFDGTSLSDSVLDQKEISGNLMTQLRQLDELIPIQIKFGRSSGSGLQHENTSDYPLQAIRELVMNAVMHRVYEGTTAPIKINWFNDRIEIQNAGGLYGHVTPDNFRSANDYRNPVLAEAMKALGYVERFGVGVSRAFSALEKNGNPPPEFVFEDTHVLVVLRAR